jgi:hypothetical protein
MDMTSFLSGFCLLACAYVLAALVAPLIQCTSPIPLVVSPRLFASLVTPLVNLHLRKPMANSYVDERYISRRRGKRVSIVILNATYEILFFVKTIRINIHKSASLAQSVERQTLNLKVAGSTPAWGFHIFCCFLAHGRKSFCRVACLSYRSHSSLSHYILN